MILVLIILFAAVLAMLMYSGMFFVSFFDDITISLIGRPLFIHNHYFPKKITAEQEFLLRQKFQFYQKLSPKEKIYFHHRLACFIRKYQFIGREDFVITNEVQTLIAATYVMLTFGMRKYLVDVFDKILIYPQEYLSTQSEEYYKGEFNPRMKVVVFSWKDFIEGYEIDNDNLNLGIHEFSHVVHCNSLRKNDASSLAFRKYHTQLTKEVNYAPNRQKLIDSDYFRIYAYTNHFEFISVIIEHYFETPLEFKSKFPQLFHNVSRMLNHRH